MALLHENVRMQYRQTVSRMSESYRVLQNLNSISFEILVIIRIFGIFIVVRVFNFFNYVFCPKTSEKKSISVDTHGGDPWSSSLCVR